MTEKEYIQKLYIEHEKTLDMIDRDRSNYYKSDFYEEQKARATNIQSRIETLKLMRDLVESYPMYLSSMDRK